MVQIVEAANGGEALTFDDVLLQPAHSTVMPGQVSVATRIAQDIDLNLPIMSSAMDTVTEGRLAIAMAQAGGIGVIHRNLTPQEQAEEVRQVKKFESGMVVNPVTIGPDATLADALHLMKVHRISGIPVVDRGRSGRLVGILTNRDVRFASNPDQKIHELMTRENLVTVRETVDQEEAKRLLHQNRIEKLLVVDTDGRCVGLITVKDIEKSQLNPHASKDAQGRLRVAAATSVGEDGLERAERLIDAGIDLLVIDTAHGHSQRVLDAVTQVKKLSNSVRVMAGNVATREGTRALIDAGADAVKVGIGPGSICTTRIVAGVGVPQLSAIMACGRGGAGSRHSCDRRRRHQVFRRFRQGDGRRCLSGDDRVAARRHRRKPRRGLSAPGPLLQGLSRYGVGRSHGTRLGGPLLPGGGARHAEARAGRHRGSGALQGAGIGRAAPAWPAGSRRRWATSGAADLAEFHRRATFVRISNAGLRESHAHDVTITRESPNYPGV